MRGNGKIRLEAEARERPLDGAGVCPDWKEWLAFVPLGALGGELVRAIRGERLAKASSDGSSGCFGFEALDRFMYVLRRSMTALSFRVSGHASSSMKVWRFRSLLEAIMEVFGIVL